MLDLLAPVNLIHHHLSINCWARSWLDASFLVCQKEKKNSSNKFTEDEDGVFFHDCDGGHDDVTS
jgi:hypothetical protein